MNSNSIFEQFNSKFDANIVRILSGEGIHIDDPNRKEEDFQQISDIIQNYITENKGLIRRICKKNQNYDVLKARKFYKNYYAVWGNCIQISKLHRRLLEDICTQTIIKAEKENVKGYVLAKLMGKSIRTYSEIISLISDGFPYGAASLTRTLFELMVITRFIVQCNDNVALEYYKASAKPLDEQDYNNYSWAESSGIFKPNEKITLGKLQKECNLDNAVHFKLYAFHCKFAHATPQTVNFDIDAVTDDTYYGPSMQSIDVPANNAALLIRNIMLDYLIYIDEDNISIKALFCAEWVIYLCDKYNEAAKKLQNTKEK